MVADMRLFLYDMLMSFTEIRNTPASRSRSREHVLSPTHAGGDTLR
jgi:hypothetical protein